MSQSANIELNLKVSRSANQDLSTASQLVNYTKLVQLLNGTASGQANANFSDQREVAASAADTLELFGGLTDAFGNALEFTRINAIAIVADADNGADLEVSGDLAGLFGGTDPAVMVRPGGVLLLACSDATGYAVTDTTAESITVTNGDTEAAANYDVILIGSV